MGVYKVDYPAVEKYIKENEDKIVMFATEENESSAKMILVYWFKYCLDKQYEDHYKRSLSVWVERFAAIHPNHICSGCPDGWCLGCAPISPGDEV